jgi:hypothetical protein
MRSKFATQTVRSCKRRVFSAICLSSDSEHDQQWLSTTFGTWGSQVQILPLRPAFSMHDSATGPDMGNETAFASEIAST